MSKTAFFVSKALLLMLSLAAVRLAAQQLTLAVSQTTDTQAILTYTAPSASACSVQVSQSSSLSPLVHDVDPVLFPGADLDSRSGSAANGLQRTFVIGNRRSDLGTDNNLYSRALQANTLHYYRVTCGSSTASGQFSTANRPLGNDYPDVPPFNSAGFGNYAWPTVNWNDQTQTYIDPMTGIALKRVTSAGWYGQSNTGNTFWQVIDINSKWTNPSNVLSGSAGTVASYSGTGNDPLFVAFDAANVKGFNGYGFSTWQPTQTFDNDMLRIFGRGTGTITGCISIDSGQTCASPTFDFVNLATAGSSNPAGTYPTSCATETSTGCFPNQGFWGGWNFAPVEWELAPTAGNVNVSGSTVTAAYAGAIEFNLNWKPGGKVYIGGSSCTNNLCTIASVQTSTSMTIVENAGTLSSQYLKTANTGYKIWVKPTGGTLTATISVNHDLSYSDNFQVGLNGQAPQCSSVPTTVSYAADGVTSITPVPGQLCLAFHTDGTAEVLYLLIPSTGETRLLDPIYFYNGSDLAADRINSPVNASVRTPQAAFDATDPNTFYALVSAQGGWSIFKAVYNAATYKYRAYPHSLYPSATASYDPGQDTTQYWYLGPQWSDIGITWTNITKPSLGLDLLTQIAAGDPTNYSTTLFNPSPPINYGVYNGQYFIVIPPQHGGASPESMTLIYSFNLSTGLLSLKTNSWSTWPSRWCASHALEVSDGWVQDICNPLGGVFNFGGYSGVMGIGPWQFTPTAMYKSGAFTSDTSMTTSSPQDTCPTIPAFLTSILPPNPKCVTFQSQMACSHTPYPGEATKWPCEYNPAYSEIQQLAPGDGFMINNGGTYQEMGLIVSVTPLGSANYQFTAVRAATISQGQGYQSTPNGWTAYALPPTAQCATTGCAAGTGLWFNSTLGSVTWLLDDLPYGHSDLGTGPTTGALSFCHGNGCRYNLPMSTAIGQPFNVTFSGGPPFAGASTSPNLSIQSYPSLHQLAAPPYQQHWMLDFAHVNPSGGVGSEVIANVGPITYSLVSGTTTVYQFTPNGGVDYKRIPLLSWAGYHLLQDVSSPATGNIITDSTPWQLCYAYAAGECRSGSSAGSTYASIPQSSTSTQCVSNWYDDNYPCVASPQSGVAFGIQRAIDRTDPAGEYGRNITMGFSGPGRQYQFAAFIPDPTGAWGLMQGVWVNGSRCDLFMAQLPPWPYDQDAVTNGSTFVPVTVTLGPSAELDQARVRFGYAENGNPASFFCTARQENCSTTTNSSMPYAFESEGPAWQSCSGGCTINIPALPGRVLYYAIDRKSSSSGRVQLGNLQIQANP